jgi:hypothetical protein
MKSIAATASPKLRHSPAVLVPPRDFFLLIREDPIIFVVNYSRAFSSDGSRLLASGGRETIDTRRHKLNAISRVASEHRRI